MEEPSLLVRVIGEICVRLALAAAGRAVPVCEPVFSKQTGFLRESGAF